MREEGAVTEGKIGSAAEAAEAAEGARAAASTSPSYRGMVARSRSNETLTMEGLPLSSSRMSSKTTTSSLLPATVLWCADERCSGVGGREGVSQTHRTDQYRYTYHLRSNAHIRERARHCGGAVDHGVLSEDDGLPGRSRHALVDVLAHCKRLWCRWGWSPTDRTWFCRQGGGAGPSAGTESCWATSSDCRSFDGCKAKLTFYGLYCGRSLLKSEEAIWQKSLL
jgi:hypothetical protein